MELQTLTSTVLPLLAQFATTVKEVVKVELVSNSTDLTAVAVIIAAIAVLLSLWQIWATRRHNRLSVTPQLVHVINAEDTDEEWGMFLRNTGVGPAKIKKILIVVDGKEYSTDSSEDLELAIDLISKKLERRHAEINPRTDFNQIFPTTSFSRFSNNLLLPAGEYQTLFSVKSSSPTVDEKRAFISVLDEIGVTSEYESLYGDKYLTVT